MNFHCFARIFINIPQKLMTTNGSCYMNVLTLNGVIFKIASIYLSQSFMFLMEISFFFYGICNTCLINLNAITLKLCIYEMNFHHSIRRFRNISMNLFYLWYANENFPQLYLMDYRTWDRVQRNSVSSGIDWYWWGSRTYPLDMYIVTHFSLCFVIILTNLCTFFHMYRWSPNGLSRF